MKPKISIITICFNAEHVIEPTIKSVLNQDYENYEYIIVDGLSKDKTMTVVNKYTSKLSKVISEKDDGISDAFNKGIELATGDIVCFLNAGDTFIGNDVLSTVATDWQKKREDVIFYIMKAGKFGFTPAEYYQNDKEKIWNDMAIPHQACFCKRNLFSEIGYFDKTLKIRMDYDFFARCVKNKRTYRYIPKVITNYDDGGVSAQNTYLSLKEGMKVKRRYGFKITLKERWYGFKIIVKNILRFIK